jgi:tRNA G18 (ribose-2'-O)-methylase SpoU
VTRSSKSGHPTGRGSRIFTEFVTIERLDDERLATFRLNERGLADRRSKRDDAGAGLFLAEGDLVVGRALDAGCRPLRALVDGSRIPDVATRFVERGGEAFVGGDEVRRMVAGLGVLHSIIALFHRPARPFAAALAQTSSQLVVIEGVDNPANIGSIIRNAAALGWDGVLLDHTSADPLSRRALRVAMGTAFSVPHARTTDLTGELAAMGDRILYALTPDPDAIDIRSIAGTLAPDAKRAVLIGSERAGLSADVRSIATPIRIPMAAGVDSLNAAAAAAVACFALGRS